MSRLTTAKLGWLPSAAAAVSVTPVGTAWAWSAWVEVDPSLDAAFLPSHIAITSPITVVTFEIELGVGTAGNEVGIGVIRASMGSGASTTDYAAPSSTIPFGLVGAARSVGERLAVRMRKSGTNTSAWKVAVGGFDAIGGNTQVTDLPQKTSFPGGTGVSLTRATVWGPGAWVEVGVFLAGAMLTGWSFDAGSDTTLVELEVGFGGSGFETVVGNYTWQNAIYGIRALKFPHPILVSAQTRVSVRVRGPNSTTMTGSLAYYGTKLPGVVGRSRGMNGFEQITTRTPNQFLEDTIAVCDGTARSGRGYGKALKRLGTTAVNSCYLFAQREEDQTPLGDGVTAGDRLRARGRFYMRINAITGTGAVMVGGVGYSSLQYDSRGLEIDPATMKWRINAFGTGASAYSASALPLGAWLRVDVHVYGQHMTSSQLEITCNGETLTKAGPVSIDNLNILNLFDTTGTTVAFDIDVDDCVWWGESFESADETYPTIDLPEDATHVKLLKLAYSGMSTGWTGTASDAYHARKVHGGAATTLRTETAGQTQTLRFQSLTDIGAAGVWGIDIFMSGLQSGSMGFGLDIFGLDTLAVLFGTTLAGTHRCLFDIEDADLGQNLTLVSTAGTACSIGSFWAYVLCTDDTDPPEEGAATVDYSDYWTSGISVARDPFKAVAGYYIGTGTPQKITLPYEPVAVLIREHGNANYNRAILAIDRTPGSNYGFHFTDSYVEQGYEAVQDMLNDGFVVGPHRDTSGMTGCNRIGCRYDYIALFDKGGGEGGQMMETTFVNTEIYDAAVTQIPIETGFEPGLIFISEYNAAGVIWTSPWQHGMRLNKDTATSGQVTGVSPSGFVLNEAPAGLWNSPYKMNIVSFSNDLLNKFFSCGEYVGTGLAKTVPTPPLAKHLLLIQSSAHSSILDNRFWTPYMGQGYSMTWNQQGNPSLDTSRIAAVADESFSPGANLSVNGRTYDWLALHEYQQEQVQGSGFPASKTLIVSPTRGTNLSDGKTVTLADGTLFNAAYPLANLTDGKGRTACRLLTTYGRFVIDLGAAYSPDLVAVVNHNIDPGLVVGVMGSNNADMSAPSLVAGFAATSDPVNWVDLRSFAFSACRYWSIEVLDSTPNSVGLTFGEFIVATADAFEGVIDPDHEAVWRTFRERAYTEYGLPYSMSSGARQRALKLGLTLFTDEMDTIEEIFDDAGANGKRVLVIPDSRVHEAFFVEWASQLDRTRENEWVEKGSLELLEESFGVVHRGLA